MLKTSHRSEKNKSATLRAVEEQINLLNQVLKASARSLRFSSDIEKQYLRHRNRRFLDVDIKIIAAGLLVYLAFAWSDFYIGGERAHELLMIRCSITAILFLGVIWIPRSPLGGYIVPLTAVGIAVVGTSVIYFIYLLEGLPRYAYHLGLVPIQVFAMVSMRLSYRSFLVTSVFMMLVYTVIASQIDLSTDTSEVGRIIMSLQPYFLAFWLVLVAMGGYLAYVMEAAFRSDYMKNRILALEADRLQILTRKLQLLSTTDSLTQIANRRHFEQVFDSEWRRCQRNNESLALVMVDVDAFKEYNDTYGHQMGDECLRRIAASISDGCRRSTDLCARYGGEEFVILLPQMAEQGALELANNVRQAIEDLAIEHRTSEIGVVTISAGIACQTPQHGDQSEDLIRLADQRLYQAKSAGRNIVLHNE
ncbi:diguanylate cyclase [Bacterioplanoides sp.]|uniref:diguanylate cyclase n=1 Tax=Bacterioplanoides sp. TaxID=2066072 RepID=UPI003B5CEE3A